MGQSDFDTRYYTISEESLPSVDELSIVNFDLPRSQKKTDFRSYFNINVDNYRSNVDMVGAIEDQMQPSPSFVDIGEIQSDFYGSGATRNYRSDGKTRVENTVYREMRGLTLLDPCPPFGVCARCAPYRVGRGF
jgi:hypothetical protein